MDNFSCCLIVVILSSYVSFNNGKVTGNKTETKCATFFFVSFGVASHLIEIKTCSKFGTYICMFRSNS